MIIKLDKMGLKANKPESDMEAGDAAAAHDAESDPILVVHPNYMIGDN